MNSDTDNLMIEALLRKDQNVFSQIFTDDGSSTNITPEVENEAKEIFNTLFPDQNFENFIQRYKNNKMAETNDSSTICNKLAYDTSKRKMINIEPPRTKKSRSTDFDLIEFLKQRADNGHSIHFQSDFDLESELEALQEEQPKQSVTDSSLRKIARAITVLNSACSYRLLDIHSEKIIR